MTGEVMGNVLHLAFAMKVGPRAKRWLYLQPGGQVSRNRMVVTKFGLPVTSLDETIRRIPGQRRHQLRLYACRYLMA